MAKKKNIFKRFASWVEDIFTPSIATLYKDPYENTRKQEKKEAKKAARLSDNEYIYAQRKKNERKIKSLFVCKKDSKGYYTVTGLKKKMAVLYLPDNVIHFSVSKDDKNLLFVEEIYFGEKLKCLGEGVFEGHKNIKTVHFHHNSHLYLREIPTNAFRGSSLEKIQLPTSVQTICKDAFCDCVRLHTVAFSSLKTDYKKSGKGFVGTLEQGAFKNCKNLKIFNFRVNKIENRAFYGCSQINLDISGTSYIDENAFENATLCSVVFGKSIKHIGDYAFKNCTVNKIGANEEIELTELGKSAFDRFGKNNDFDFSKFIGLTCESFQDFMRTAKANNYGFTRLILPPSVKKLDKDFFNGCGEIKLLVGTDVTEIEAGVFNSLYCDTADFRDCARLKKIEDGTFARNSGQICLKWLSLNKKTKFSDGIFGEDEFELFNETDRIRFKNLNGEHLADIKAERARKKEEEEQKQREAEELKRKKDAEFEEWRRQWHLQQEQERAEKARLRLEAEEAALIKAHPIKVKKFEEQFAYLESIKPNKSCNDEDLLVAYIFSYERLLENAVTSEHRSRVNRVLDELKDIRKPLAYRREVRKEEEEKAKIAARKAEYERQRKLRAKREAEFDADLKKAQAGDIIACLNVAECYQLGIGVKKDAAKAFEWYVKGELDYTVQHKGHAFMGDCYYDGTVTSRNWSKACEHYKAFYSQWYSDPTLSTTDMINIEKAQRRYTEIERIEPSTMIGAGRTVFSGSYSGRTVDVKTMLKEIENKIDAGTHNNYRDIYTSVSCDFGGTSKEYSGYSVTNLVIILDVNGSVDGLGKKMLGSGAYRGRADFEEGLRKLGMSEYDFNEISASDLPASQRSDYYRLKELQQAAHDGDNYNVMSAGTAAYKKIAQKAISEVWDKYRDYTKQVRTGFKDAAVRGGYKIRYNFKK